MKKYLVMFLAIAALFTWTATIASADSYSYSDEEASYPSEPTKAVKKAAKRGSSESRLSGDDAEFASDYKKREAKEGYIADRDCSCRGSAYCFCAPSSGGYWDGYYGGYGYGYGYGSGFGAASGPWSSGW